MVRECKLKTDNNDASCLFMLDVYENIPIIWLFPRFPHGVVRVKYKPYKFPI